VLENFLSRFFPFQRVQAARAELLTLMRCWYHLELIYAQSHSTNPSEYTIGGKNVSGFFSGKFSSDLKKEIS
jgi:hypothetical protein